MSRGNSLLDGVKLVSSSAPSRQRLTKYELARMSHDDQLAYHLWGPKPTSLELEAELRREQEIEDFELHDELIVGSRLYDDGPDTDY